MAPVGTTVLIVDDHADFRTFARSMLEAGGFDVVGEAADGASALSSARGLKPRWYCWTSNCPTSTASPCVSSSPKTTRRRRWCSPPAATSRRFGDGSDAAARAGSSRRLSCRRRRSRRSSTWSSTRMRAAPVALVATGVCLGIASVQASYEPGEIGAAIADLGVGWVLHGLRARRLGSPAREPRRSADGRNRRGMASGQPAVAGAVPAPGTARASAAVVSERPPGRAP